MYKTLFFFSLLILSSLKVQGQCVIDAGPNRNICPEEARNNPQLFGKVISGDVVQVKWETEYYIPVLDQSYYASSFLTDTTILAPTIKSPSDKTGKFYLTGITSTGETCRDSVEINFSNWMVILLQKLTGKQPKDTVRLWPAASSVWGPMQYAWSPNYMISDTTVRNPLVWNDTTVFYDLLITDALGCTVDDGYFSVFVQATSTNEWSESDLKIYPNPVNNQLNIESSKAIDRIQVFDAAGGLLGAHSQTNGINFSPYPTGNLILKVIYQDEAIEVRRVVKVDQ